VYVPSSDRTLAVRPVFTLKTRSGASEESAIPTFRPPSHHGAGVTRTGRASSSGNAT
jgi:hypothetical protein